MSSYPVDNPILEYIAIVWYCVLMKEYPISFLVRLQPKHKNILLHYKKKVKVSEAAVIRYAIEQLPVPYEGI